MITYTLNNIQLKLYSSPSVFSSDEIDPGTDLLLKNLIIPEKGNVLDLGTGIGIIGIYLAKANPKLHVYMSDVNPIAIKLSKKNIKENNVEKNTVVVECNLYEKFKENFFVAIYTNPPISAGWETIEKIITDGIKYLQEKGVLQMVLSVGHERALEVGKKIYKSVEIIEKKKGYAIIIFKK